MFMLHLFFCCLKLGIKLMHRKIKLLKIDCNASFRKCIDKKVSCGRIILQENIVLLNFT